MTLSIIVFIFIVALVAVAVCAYLAGKRAGKVEYRRLNPSVRAWLKELGISEVAYFRAMERGVSLHVSSDSGCPRC